MTEQDWLDRAHPNGMLKFLRTIGLLSERKLRLFAAGVSRRVWALLTDDLFRRAIEEAERFADGSSDATQLTAVRGEALIDYDWLGGVNDVAYTLVLPPPEFGVREAIGIAVEVADALSRASFPDADFDHDSHLDAHDVREIEFETHSHLVRCVFGNPFQSIAFDPMWRTPDVLALAHAAYDERLLPSGELDPARLAVLSDALEEAGCPDAILDHLRSPMPHARGCWPLDLCLDLR